jgi:DNA-directed RNA polymerase specialized sigma24 family protein
MSTLRSDVLNITTERTAILSPSTSEREQLVLSLLNQVTPLIRHCARTWNLNFEDLYQDATIHIIHLVDTKKNPQKLLSLTRLRVRSRIIDTLRYNLRHQALSLDTPSHQDSDLTVADLLPSPYSHDPLSIILTQERLKQLEPKVQGLRGPHSSAVRVRYETALAEVSA